MSKEILEQINELRMKHEDQYINTLNSMIKIERDLKVFIHQHNTCELQEAQDLRFQYITPQDIENKSQMEQVIKPQTIIIDSSNNKSAPIVIAGSDGSMIHRRGRTICTASAFFGEASPLNTSVVVPMCGNTMIAESYGISLALRQAKAEAVTRLCIVADNAAAIQFAASAAVQEAANSQPLSEYLDKYPHLASTAKEIQQLTAHLELFVLVWQKSHTREKTIFSSTNSGADILCRTYAEAVATRLLTQ